jgi:hypothetical protein
MRGHSEQPRASGREDASMRHRTQILKGNGWENDR